MMGFSPRAETIRDQEIIKFCTCQFMLYIMVIVLWYEWMYKSLLFAFLLNCYPPYRNYLPTTSVQRKVAAVFFVYLYKNGCEKLPNLRTPGISVFPSHLCFSVFPHNAHSALWKSARLLLFLLCIAYICTRPDRESAPHRSNSSEMAGLPCKEEVQPIEKFRNKNAPGADGEHAKDETKMEERPVSKQEPIAVYSVSKKQEDIPVLLAGDYIKSEPMIATKTGEDDVVPLESNMELAESNLVEEEVMDEGGGETEAKISKKRIRKKRDRKKEYAREKSRRETLRALSEGSGAEAEAAREELAKFRNKQKRAYTNRRAKLTKARKLAVYGTGEEAERARELVAEDRRKHNLYARREYQKKKALCSAMKKSSEENKDGQE